MSQDLFRKVKKIEIGSKRKMTDLLSGGLRSHFKGQGVQFSEHRVYMPGDDIRHMDWKVSARSRDPLIKLYEEERDLNILIVADFSKSLSLPLHQKTQHEWLAEMGSVLAVAAQTGGDKVGAILFAHQIIKHIPLKKGQNHVLRIIRELYAQPLIEGGTALDEALSQANRILKHTGVVFVLSDFTSDSFATSLKKLSRKHDVVCIKLKSPYAEALEKRGIIVGYNPETGAENIIDLNRSSQRKEIHELNHELAQYFKHACEQSRAETLDLETNTQDHPNLSSVDPTDAVVRFLRRRKRTK